MSTRMGYHRAKAVWQPSAAQQRVLDGIAAGESNPAIAERLGLSFETVKWHVSELLAETGCADRSELAQWWREQQQAQKVSRTRTIAIILALAALAVVAIAVAVGVGVVIVAPGGGRAHAPAAKPAAAARAPAGTAPTETAPTPAPSVTPSPPDQPDPASSLNGNGPAVFVWQSDGGLADFAPTLLALDAQDNLYVMDVSKNRIVKFDRDGKLLTTWGSSGTGDGQFEFRHPPGRAGGIAVDANGIIDVMDDSGRMQQFTSSGRFLGAWPSRGTGSAPGQFSWPGSLAIAHNGTVYIGDGGPDAGRIQVFAPDGSLRGVWGSPGSGPGEFYSPQPLAVDRAGKIYVADTDNDRVVVLDAQGRVVRTWGGVGFGSGQIIYPLGLALDAAGDVYVSDEYQNRVVKFDSQ